MKNVIVLLSNNSDKDPFLYSQLLDIYNEVSDYDYKYVFCDSEREELSSFKIINNGLANNTLLRYVIFYINLFKLLFKNRSNNITIHVRGFISAIIFFFFPKNILKSYKYIYDPRGAVILNFLEKSKYLKYGTMFFSVIEKNIIENSLMTIVESEKLKTHLANEYGKIEKYTTCYNSTSLFPLPPKNSLKTKELINICYTGSLNYWHDIYEIKRVFEHLIKILSTKKIVIHILTQERYHSVANEVFDFHKEVFIKFVPYNEMDDVLEAMDICVSVVRPTKSTVVTSPIKIADYINKGKIIVANSGIGDFDEFFIKNNSVLLYNYKEVLTFTKEDLYKIRTDKNVEILHNFRIETNRKTITKKIQR